MNKKNILLLCLIVTVMGIGGVVGYVYFNSVNTTIRLVNIRSATVRYNGFTLGSSAAGETIHFRAPKSSTIDVGYVGNKTYESSKRTLSIRDMPETKTVSAYYSKQELKKRAVTESDAVKNAIGIYNPSIQSLYSIDSIRLYHFAEWGSAKLIWSGDDSENSDNLRLILNKTEQGWSVVNKPDILLYRDYYSSVPIDILREVNNN